MKLSVVIPVYNEIATISELLDRVRRVEIEKEIIIVDDGSTDGTRAFLEQIDEHGVRVFFHDVNQGKGAALRTGFRQAEGDMVLVQDGDLEYDPAEYSALVDPILRGVADAVYGSRLSGGRPQRVYMFWHLVGNRFLTLVCNVLYNTTLTDMETCYKVFRRELIQGITIESNDFAVEPEITAKILKRRCRLYEVPISYYGRTYDEGKKITWRDGFKALWTLLKYRVVN